MFCFFQKVRKTWGQTYGTVWWWKCYHKLGWRKKMYINVYKSWVAAFYVYSNMSLKSRSSEDIRLGSARRWHFTEVSTAGRRGPAKSKGHSFSQVQNTTSYCIPGYRNRLNKYVSSVCFGILVFSFLMDRKELSSAHAELGWNEILQKPHMKGELHHTGS